jgi:hypothetical protein
MLMVFEVVCIAGLWRCLWMSGMRKCVAGLAVQCDVDIAHILILAHSVGKWLGLSSRAAVLTREGLRSKAPPGRASTTHQC